ncbi:MAG TPA: alkaline phosphatase D family protein, partial [Burkholderiaceae bacterium]|nr:alkaline phosphatase D family protein [Burkholderiaceae bacterium]
ALLLLGDQVYVDATAGVFDPRALDDRFRFAYERRRRLAIARTRAAADRVHALIDDHEIEDNWEPDGSRATQALREEALTYFKREHGLAPAAPLWRVEARPLPMFLTDTRTDRTPRTATSAESARLIGDAQFDALCAFLLDQPRDVPKVVASPAILLPRHRVAAGHPAHALRSDSWDGYPHTFHRLLAFIARERIRNVVFVSGDEHLGCVARARLARAGDQAEEVTVHSIHTPALYAPYPFANAVPEDFDRTPFTFRDPGVPHDLYQCEIDLWFPSELARAASADGFAVVEVAAARRRPGWCLTVAYEFADARWRRRFWLRT